MSYKITQGLQHFVLITYSIEYNNILTGRLRNSLKYSTRKLSVAKEFSCKKTQKHRIMLMLFSNMPTLFSNSAINRLYIDLQLSFSQPALNPHCKQRAVLQSLEGRNLENRVEQTLGRLVPVLSWKTTCEKHSTLQNETSTKTKCCPW